MLLFYLNMYFHNLHVFLSRLGLHIQHLHASNVHKVIFRPAFREIFLDERSDPKYGLSGRISSGNAIGHPVYRPQGLVDVSYVGRAEIVSSAVLLLPVPFLLPLSSDSLPLSQTCVKYLSLPAVPNPHTTFLNTDKFFRIGKF